MREIDKLGKLSEKEVLENLKKYKAEKILNLLKKPESFFKKFKAYKEIEELKKLCRNFGLNVEFLPSLARGLSYYNGNVFEARVKDSKESIAGGGAYLINNIQSFGYGLGLERLSSLAKIIPEKNQVLVLSIGQEKEAIKLAEKIRVLGKNVVLMYDKVSKALDYANSNKIAKVVFVGKEEIKKKQFKIRDMKTGKEKFVSEKELLKNI